MPLTKEQVAAYLADPWTCPFCGAQGEDLGAFRSDDWDDLDEVELMVRISCSKCDKTGATITNSMMLRKKTRTATPFRTRRVEHGNRSLR